MAGDREPPAALARLQARLEALGPLRAWDARLPSLPWADPAFSERMLGEHLSQAHDLASRRSDIIAAQVAWLDAQLPPGSHLLDGGCGPGLHALPLAARGHRVSGVDVAPAAIRHAREQGAPYRDRLDFHLGDLRRLDLTRRFDASIILYGQFETFSPPDAGQVLARLHHHLRPGARLFLELRDVARVDRRSYRTWWEGENDLFSRGSYLLLYEHGWDEAASAEVERYLIAHKEGALEMYDVTERHLEVAAWEQLLQRTGFAPRQLHRDWPSDRPDEWYLLEAVR